MEVVVGGKIESIAKELANNSLNYYYEVRVAEFSIVGSLKGEGFLISLENIENLDIYIENDAINAKINDKNFITKIIIENNGLIINFKSNIDFNINIGDYINFVFELDKQENYSGGNQNKEKYKINFTKIKLI